MTIIAQNTRTKKSLAETHPHLVGQWSANNSKTPYDVTYGSCYRTEWICPNYSDHVWTVPVKSRASNGWGCPYCSSNKILAGFNDLQTMSPTLAVSWDFERNYPLTPQDVMANSRKSVHWICESNPTHRWQAKIYSRNLGTGCPDCKMIGTSKIEISLRDELKTTSLDVLDSTRLEIPWTLSHMYVDILATSQGRNIVIEYDGAYWHQDTGDRDVRKTEILLENGFVVVRIRQTPLPLLDIVDDNLHQIPYEYSQSKPNICHLVETILAHLQLP